MITARGGRQRSKGGLPLTDIRDDCHLGAAHRVYQELSKPYTQAMTHTATRPAPRTRLRGISSVAILVLGVVVVPVSLVVIFNSYTAPDADAYVRMAFAQVAGATIAIGTVVGLVVQRIARRSPIRETAWFGLIAVVVTAWQISSLASAADFLLTGLGL